MTKIGGKKKTSTNIMNKNKTIVPVFIAKYVCMFECRVSDHNLDATHISTTDSRQSILLQMHSARDCRLRAKERSHMHENHSRPFDLIETKMMH